MSKTLLIREKSNARLLGHWMLAAALVWLGVIQAQAQANLYTFSQTTGNAYTPLPAPTVLGASTTTNVDATDDAVYPVTLPFSFTFGGVAYTSLSVNTNGYITFGATASTATGYTPISATRGYAGAISALGSDLAGSPAAANLGELSYQTLGSSPNQTLVVQWKNYLRYSGGYLSDNINFQIRLSEGSNLIELAYGPFTTVATATAPQVGLRGATNAVFTNRTTTTNWSASTAGITNAATMALNNTIKPANGLTYLFTPPVPCTAPPTAGTAVATPASGCTSVTSLLSLTGSATGSGVTYQWQQSATGTAGSYTNVSTGGTSATYTATALTSSTYFQALVTCSGQTATSAAVQVVVNPIIPPYAALPVTEGFENWLSRCATSEVPTNNWRAVPTTGNASWRREDQGFSTATWSFIDDEPAPYSTASSQGSHSARFHTYGLTAGTGSLDLFVDLSAAGTKTLTFDYINPTGTDVLDVLLSTDGGATFGPTPLLSLGTNSAFGGKSVTFTATSATSVIRFRATTDYGADDIGIDKLLLQVTPACPGVAFSPITSITSTSATVNFAASPGATSYTVNYSPGGTAQTVTSAGAVPLTGLLPYTLYTVTVTTNCGAQSGTATTSFRTAIGNDECAGAVSITPGAAGAGCSAQTYTTSGATASAVTSACTAVADGDVWFSFVAGGTRHSITVTPTFDFDAVIELRSGTCPGTSVNCQNASTSGGGAGAETLVATGLTPGNTYLVRVYSALAGASSGNFDICITTPANLPCAQVTNAAVVNTGSTGTASTATLTFDPAAGATDYYITLTPTAGGTAITGTLAGSPVNLTGLTPSTSYTVTISTNCSNGGVSNPVTVVFTSAAAPTPPANDDCANATLITCGQTLNGTTIAATTTGEPTAACGSDGNSPSNSPSVFYRFVGTGDIVTATTCGTGTTIDTELFVYSGSCGTLTCVDSNDDFSGCSANTAASQVTFTSVVGTTYYFMVQRFGAGNTGAFSLNVSCVAPPSCAPVTSLAATTTPTTANLTFTAGNGNTSYVVTYTPTGGATATVTPAPVASPVALAGLTPSTTYAVSVQAVCSVGGTATATTLSFTTPALPPANDNCTAAVVLTSGTTCTPTSGTVAGATQSLAPILCSGFTGTAPAQDVWYQFIATNSTHTIAVTGTFDGVLEVLSGACGSTSNVGCADASGNNETLTLTSLAVGTTYRIRYYPYNPNPTSSTFTICITGPAPAPANDLCSGAIALTCGQTVTGTTTGATTTGDPTADCGTTVSAQGGVFYSFLGTGDVVTVTTCSGPTAVTGDTKLFVYSGTCGTLTCVAGNDDLTGSCTNTVASSVTFTSITGTQYYFFVQGFSGPLDFGLNLTCALPVTNLVVSTPQNVSGTYNNVTVQSGGIATLTGALTVNGTLTVQSGGVLAQNCQTLTGPGSFELQAGGELQICNQAGIATTGATGAVQVAGIRTYAADASYTYNGTVAQVTGTGLPGTVRNLTVNNSTGLTLSQALSISQVVRLQNGSLATGGQPFTLLSSAAGTALVDNSGGGSVNGIGTMQRAITNAVTGPAYRHFSSPVQNTSLADLTTAGFAPTFNAAYNSSATPNVVTPFPTVFGYDQARIATVTSTYGAFDKGWFSPTGSGDLMVPTRGYTVNAPATAIPIDFVGTFNNAAQNSGTLSRGPDANAGWQLLGNPYPAPLDWNTVAAAQRPGMDGAMYIYQSTGRYAGTYRSFDNGIGASSLIDAGSGYFTRVSTPGAPGAVNLTNANRITVFGAQPAFGRGPADTRPQLQLLLAGAGLSDETYLYLEQGATAGIDAQYDATKLANPAGLDLASLSGSAPLAINGLAPLAATDVVVPLTMRVPQAGSFSFEVGDLANFGATTVYLRDALTGTQLLLATGSRYQFALATATAGNGRFSVLFRPAAVTATKVELNAAAVSVYPNPSHGSFTVLLPPLAGQREVQASLVNALGQVVLTRTIGLTAAGATTEFNTRLLATGVYMLRLQAETKTLTKRVVVE